MTIIRNELSVLRQTLVYKRAPAVSPSQSHDHALETQAPGGWVVAGGVARDVAAPKQSGVRSGNAGVARVNAGDQALPAVLAALVEEHVEFVVFGAVALMAHGLVRATQDLDIFVRADAENVARLRQALRRVYPEDSAIDEITHGDLAGDYPAVRYNAPDGFGIDVLSRLGTAWTYEAIESEVKEFQGLRIRVATPGMLYRMKKDTVRWKDRIDAAALRERFGLEE